MSFRLFVGAVLVTATLARTAGAQQIFAPNATYQAATTKLTIPASPGSLITSVQGGSYTANFQNASGGAMALQAREMDPSLPPTQPAPPNRPYTWATWNRPPYSEYDGSYILPVAWTQGGTFLQFVTNVPVGVFGFEAEPNTQFAAGGQSASASMTASFYFQNALVGSFTQQVNGFGGALLFAFQNSAGIDRVDFVSTDDFAVSNIRVAAQNTRLGADAFNPVVPEPSTVLLLGGGLVGVASIARRRLKPTA